MGTILNKMSDADQCCSSSNSTSVESFQFHDLFVVDFNNGLFFNGIYIPEEILINILSFIHPNELLKKSEVCKYWCNIIKSSLLWIKIYKRHYPGKAKKLPWYVYYNYFTTDNFKNLIKNGNGELKYEHWKIVKNFGDEFKIENPPAGVEALPANVPEFHGHKSCFATSFYECNKEQIMCLKNKRLLRYIINQFKPHIYVSEWIAGRFDCSCVYHIAITGYYKEMQQDLVFYSEQLAEVNPIIHERKKVTMAAGENTSWKKVELLIKDYKPGLKTLVFEHEGHDTQFWKGHYGSKMAGAVVKFVFDSIDPTIK